MAIASVPVAPTSGEVGAQFSPPSSDRKTRPSPEAAYTRPGTTPFAATPDIGAPISPPDVQTSRPAKAGTANATATTIVARIARQRSPCLVDEVFPQPF